MAQLARPKFLSPSSLKLFTEDRERYYIEKLLKRAKGFAQTQAMVAGVGFDVYVKNKLCDELGMPRVMDMAKQVENPAMLEYGHKVGFHLLGVYCETGAYKRLKDMLGVGSVRFEGISEGVIGGVPMYGKPDAEFKNICGDTVVIDWKVNGYCSQASPKKGYVAIYPGGASHKECVIKEHCGIKYNSYLTLESVDSDWAGQVATYAWMGGAPVGGVIMGMIDQLACRAGEVRVACHRAMVGEAFQQKLLKSYQELWSLLSLDDDSLRKEWFGGSDSKVKCEMLEMEIVTENVTYREI